MAYLKMFLREMLALASRYGKLILLALPCAVFATALAVVIAPLSDFANTVWIAVVLTFVSVTAIYRYAAMNFLSTESPVEARMRASNHE